MPGLQFTIPELLSENQQGGPKIRVSIFYLLIRTRTCVYQEASNVGFLKNCAYVLNEWVLSSSINMLLGTSDLFDT